MSSPAQEFQEGRTLLEVDALDHAVDVVGTLSDAGMTAFGLKFATDKQLANSRDIADSWIESIVNRSASESIVDFGIIPSGSL